MVGVTSGDYVECGGALDSSNEVQQRHFPLLPSPPPLMLHRRPHLSPNGAPDTLHQPRVILVPVLPLSPSLPPLLLLSLPSPFPLPTPFPLVFQSFFPAPVFLICPRLLPLLFFFLILFRHPSSVSFSFTSLLPIYTSP